MQFVVTTYGGGEALVLVFNGIAALLGSSGGILSGFMKITAVMGGFWAIVQSVIRNSIEVSLRWFLWFTIATNVLFLPKVTIWIKDPLIHSAPTKVDNVPFALGAFAGIISEVGAALTEKMESIFTLPDDLQYHRTGTVFASRMMAQSRQFRITDPDFNANMERFVNQCIVYDTMIGAKYTLKDLRSSEDIWALVKDRTSPIRGFVYKEPGIGQRGEILTCREGARKLETLWHTILLEGAYKYGASLIKGDIHLAQRQFLTLFPLSYNFLTGASEDALRALRQEMMINTISDASNNKVTELGSPMNYAATKALLQQRSTYEVAGDLAATFLPVMKNLLEALIYSSFIFVFAFALMPGGYKVLATYCEMIVWLQIWAPMYAVLNLVITLYARHKTANLTGGAGVTMITSLGITEVNADMAALAGYLSMSIPFISYAIVKGGASSFVHLAGHLGSALQSAAAYAGSELSSGNFQLGNVSQGIQTFHTHSGFASNMGYSYKAGQFETVLEDGSVKVMQADGSAIFRSGSGYGISQLGVRVSMNDNISSQLSDAKARELSFMEGVSTEEAIATTQATRQAADILTRVSKGGTFGESYDQSQALSENNSWSQTSRLSDEIQRNLNVNRNEAAELAAGVSANLMVVNGSYQFKKDTAHTKQLSDAIRIAEDIGYTTSLDDLARNSKELRFQDSYGKEAALSDDFTKSVEEMNSAREAGSISKQKVDRYSQAETFMESRGFNVERDHTQELLEFIAYKKASPLSNDHIGYDAAHKIIQRGGSELDSFVQDFKETRALDLVEKIGSGDFRIQNEEDLQRLYNERSTSLNSSLSQVDGSSIYQRPRDHGFDPQEPKVQEAVEKSESRSSSQFDASPVYGRARYHGIDPNEPLRSDPREEFLKKKESQAQTITQNKEKLEVQIQKEEHSIHEEMAPQEFTITKVVSDPVWTEQDRERLGQKPSE